MARVQLVIPDEDRDRFVRQARREGMTLSAWLRTAAYKRLLEQQVSRPFESPADLEEFFRGCDALEGPGGNRIGRNTGPSSKNRAEGAHPAGEGESEQAQSVTNAASREILTDKLYRPRLYQGALLNVLGQGFHGGKTATEGCAASLEEF